GVGEPGLPLVGDRRRVRGAAPAGAAAAGVGPAHAAEEGAGAQPDRGAGEVERDAAFSSASASGAFWVTTEGGSRTRVVTEVPAGWLTSGANQWCIVRR